MILNNRDGTLFSVNTPNLRAPCCTSVISVVQSFFDGGCNLSSGSSSGGLSSEDNIGLSSGDSSDLSFGSNSVLSSSSSNVLSSGYTSVLSSGVIALSDGSTTLIHGS
ncbi:hypothetical protein ABZP36_029467 [Zizania latifolia]